MTLADQGSRHVLTPAWIRLRLAHALEKRPRLWADVNECYSGVISATCQRSDDLLRGDDAPHFDYTIIDEPTAVVNGNSRTRTRR